MRGGQSRHLQPAYSVDHTDFATSTPDRAYDALVRTKNRRKVEMAKLWTPLASALVSIAILNCPAAAQVGDRESAKVWADLCTPDIGRFSRTLSEMQSCCEQKAGERNRACKDAPNNIACVGTVRLCKEAVKCDDAWTKCQKNAMEKENDRNCEKDTCKKCAIEYMPCRKDALK
jgi:hypothetical protein